MTTTPAMNLLTVQKTGGALGPDGFIVLAVILNRSSDVARGVQIDLVAKDTAGHTLATTTATIGRIAALGTEAVAAHLSIPGQTNPATFEASIRSALWTAPSPETGAVEIVDAAFAQDPRVPNVRIRLVNHTASAQRAKITSVCFDAVGDLRGGGTSSISLDSPGAVVEISVPVAVPSQPARCDAYATSSS